MREAFTQHVLLPVKLTAESQNVIIKKNSCLFHRMKGNLSHNTTLIFLFLLLSLFISSTYASVACQCMCCKGKGCLPSPFEFKVDQCRECDKKGCQNYISKDCPSDAEEGAVIPVCGGFSSIGAYTLVVLLITCPVICLVSLCILCGTTGVITTIVQYCKLKKDAKNKNKWNYEQLEMEENARVI